MTVAVRGTNHLSSDNVKVQDNIDIVAPVNCEVVEASSTALPEVIQEILNKFSILGSRIGRSW